MSEKRRKLAIRMLKEVFKHARRDDCYYCKVLVRAAGLDPTKSYEENFNE